MKLRSASVVRPPRPRPCVDPADGRAALAALDPTAFDSLAPESAARARSAHFAAGLAGAAVALALALALGGCASERSAQGVEASALASRTATPPRAAQRPHRLEEHGHVRVDAYYWLREREDPEVLAYLKAENAYTEAVMAPTAGLQEELYQEIKGRIVETDETVPYRHDDWWYYTRLEEGREYPIHCRKHETLDAPEQVLLDVNEMAEGHGYYAVRSVSPGPDHRLVAFAVDDVGRRIYTLRFLDTETGELRPDAIEGATGNLAWATDGRTVLYARQDPQTLRSHRIWRHVLGTDPAEDELVYEETDETFRCFVWKTRSERFLMIGSFQTLASEVRYVDADDPTGEWTVFLPRERGHEYAIDHAGDAFFVRTNLDAENFRVMRAPIGAAGPEEWTEVLPHRADVLVEEVDAFADHVVVRERSAGLGRLRVLPLEGAPEAPQGDGLVEHLVEFEEPAYTVWLTDNVEFESPTLRYGYSSLKTPRSVYDWDVRTRERVLRKRDEVLGGYDPDDWAVERLWAIAEDGTRVPISLVHAKGSERDGSSPLLLYGYGSYGASMDAGFRSSVLSLLERGFVYAIAHVRGGEELGRRWYEEGKLEHKRNTFTDFIACARHLVATGWTAPEHLYAQGGSAGGLLVGAVANMAPELFDGIVADVPFVDVVTTMLDESIPLTTNEYDEWGDPRERAAYETMLSYSPYDNVVRQAYPHMLVTTGLHDSQVQYWEPAKWVAKLREHASGKSTILLKTELEAGHGGVSGRYRRFREIAFTYAWLLRLAGVEA